MIQDRGLHYVSWPPLTVLDSRGARVGIVQRCYADASGDIRLIGIDLGLAPNSQRLVPARSIQLAENGLKLAYPREAIDQSPDVVVSNVIGIDLLDQLYTHYDAGDSEAAEIPAVQPVVESVSISPPGNLVQTDDDVIEIPIYAEEIVKRTVLKEIIRVRKTWVTEQREIEVDLRTEDIEVIEEGDALVRIKAPSDSTAT